MLCATRPMTPNTVRNTISTISTGTRPTCSQARKRPTMLDASPGPVASMPVCPEPAVASRWPAMKSSTTSLTLKPVTSAMSSTTASPSMISSAITKGALPLMIIQFMAQPLALAGLQLRQALGDAVVARKRFQFGELGGVRARSARARNARVTLEDPVKGGARALGAVIHGLAWTAGSCAGAGCRGLLFHRLAIVLQRVEHLASLGLQRDHVAFEARPVFSQRGKARLQHRQLRFDIDLAAQCGLGQIFPALLDRQRSLFAQRLMARAFFGETLGSQVPLCLDRAEVGADVGDRRVDFARGLRHDALGRRVLHHVDEAVETAGNQPSD